MAIPALISNPWSTRTCCARNLSGDQHHCFQSKGFFPDELSVQQITHLDQSVTSDITEMAELSQQQKSHEEWDTQSRLHAQLLVTKINKLQTLVNRSAFKTQTSSSKDLYLLNLYAFLSRALHRMTGYPQTAHDWHWLEGHHTSTVSQHTQLPKCINSKNSGMDKLHVFPRQSAANTTRFKMSNETVLLKDYFVGILFKRSLQI